MLTLDAGGRQQINSIIVKANSKIPAKSGDRFFTVSDRQTEVAVEVTQGDDEDPSYVRILGKQTFSIPPYPAGAPIGIVYAYDIDQMIYIEVTDLTAGVARGSFEMADMNGAQVETATRRMRTIEVS